MPENLGGYIALSVTIIWFIGILAWFFRRQYGKTKTATATVVSKAAPISRISIGKPL